VLFGTTLAMGLTSFLLNEWVVSGNTHLGLLQTCTGQNCTSIHTFNCSSSAASDSCGQGELVVRGLIHISLIVTRRDIIAVKWLEKDSC